MVHSTRRVVLSFAWCYFVLVFLFLLALRLPRLGKRANLSAFRTFIRFTLVWLCLFYLPLGVWIGLRFVIVALPGLFSYLFFCKDNDYNVTECFAKIMKQMWRLVLQR